MIIIFEGIDRSGKSSMISRINKETNYEFVTLDRGPAGFIFYDQYLLRENKVRTMMHEQEALNLNKDMNVMYVYMSASPDVILQRLIEENPDNKNKYTEEGILEMSDQYEQTVNKYYRHSKVIKLNTTNLDNIKDEARKIYSYLYDFQNKYWPLRFETKEIKENHDKNFYPISVSLSEKTFKYMETFNEQCDVHFYEMIESQLDQAMYKREKGIINERNIYFINPDCIPFVQIDIDKEDKKFIIDVNQRSLNLLKHKLNDLNMFYDWFKKSKATRKYRDKGYELIINYNVAFPHEIHNFI